METRHYKTIKGLLSQCSYHELNFNDFNEGQFYHDKARKWYKFTLPEEEMRNAARLFATAVYSRVTRRQVENVLYYRGKRYGILRRLSITCRYTDDVRGSYCTGQDGEAEQRVLQGIFRE